MRVRAMARRNVIDGVSVVLAGSVRARPPVMIGAVVTFRISVVAYRVSTRRSPGATRRPAMRCGRSPLCALGLGQIS
jgi:hypothetical protein